MKTPIFDFVRGYAEGDFVRFHMPGHKGNVDLGFEKYDITEISGADVLYSAEGVIAESEENLTELYGTAHSFYSTEGSTLAIKAMLALVSQREGDERPLILAARNVHASFVRAAALLDLDVEFIYPESPSHLCSCNITADDVEGAIASLKKLPRALYLTSPDYLGNMLDISGISKVCRKHNIPLLVDNAHGAYLKFLPVDMHPITLGAAMCADSAHKTLPVLTGGAYLHISKDYSDYACRARDALSLFASTSPSYLTLSSLDLCNKRLSGDYPEKIAELTKKVAEIKKEISDLGFTLCDSEPLKIVIKAGDSLAGYLRKCGIEPEFSDGDYTVLMLTPENGERDFIRLISTLSDFEGDKAVKSTIPGAPKRHKAELSIREAIFSPCESVSAEQAEGRICAAPTVSCPPAVPIVISGERINAEDIGLFKYYGIRTLSVVK